MPLSSMDVAIDGGLDRLRRELDRLRVENVRLPRLLTLRGSLWVCQAVVGRGW